MRPTRQRGRNRQRGTVIVELAVILPLLLLLVFLMLEGGSMLRTHIIVNNAAREGVRISVLPENQGNVAAIQQRVIDYAAQNNVTIDPSEIVIVQDDAVPGPNGVFISASSVTVTHPFSLPGFAGFSGLAATTSLVGKAEFRNF